jgi:hypothetical protein
MEIPYLPVPVCLNQAIPHSNGFCMPRLSIPLGASVDSVLILEFLDLKIGIIFGQILLKIGLYLQK